MKRHRILLVAALAVGGFALTMTPAHAADTPPAPSDPIVTTPDPWERIHPPRLPRPEPCPVRPAPPGGAVPLYCEILPGPVLPIVPGPGLPVEPIIISPEDVETRG